MKIFIFGAITAWVLLILTIVLAVFCVRILSGFIQKARRGITILVFLTCAIGLTFVYSIASMSISNPVINAILCTAFLVLSWIAENALYNHFSDGEEIMNLADKNVSNLLALVCMAVSGVVCAFKYGDMGYCILFTISISIFIGEYISIEDIYSNRSFATIWNETKSKFCSAHKTVWVSGLIIDVFFLLLLIFDGFTNKLNSYLEKFSQGIAFGIISGLLICILVACCVKKIKK